jgi:pimeloyl-ACP methyl ester carboxylesterase
MTGRRRKFWRLFVTFITTLAVALAVMTTWISRDQGIGLVHPIRSSPEQTPADWPELANWEEVRFPSADGLEIVAWYVPPDPAGDGTSIIYVHGLGGNRSGLLSQAALLASHGHGALLLDLRNHGDSAGDVTTLGFVEVEDVRGAVSYLQTRPEVNQDRIVLIGHSMGGATVLRAAARIPEVAAVIAESAFASVEDNVSQGVRLLTGLPPFPFAPLIVFFGQQEAKVSIDAVRPIDDVAGIAPRPVMFIHGEQDGVILVENSQRMYQAAAEPKELYLISNAGHYPLYEVEPAEFERRVVAFLDTHLRGQQE